jgi:microcystin-dependent protein
MATPYLGEIRMMGCNFAPRGNALCNGQLLAIAQNTALFSLLGTTYGGNGQTTFALPNLQGRTPMHWGQGPGLSSYVLGEQAGTEGISLIINEMASHTHSAMSVPAPGNQYGPANGVWAQDAGNNNFYGAAASQVPLNPGCITVTGGNLPHNNLQPSLVINFIIATQGIYPARN